MIRISKKLVIVRYSLEEEKALLIHMYVCARIHADVSKHADVSNDDDDVLHNLVVRSLSLSLSIYIYIHVCTTECSNAFFYQW